MTDDGNWFVRIGQNPSIGKQRRPTFASLLTLRLPDIQWSKYCDDSVRTVNSELVIRSE